MYQYCNKDAVPRVIDDPTDDQAQTDQGKGEHDEFEDRALGGISVTSWEGIKNPGKCHRAHRLPTIRPPVKGPRNRCKRGCAKPVQPGSSKSGPPKRTIEMKARR